MAYHPLPDFYKDNLRSISTFNLVIVGKDPYVNDATGIPFCKPNWPAMRVIPTPSGYHVFNSLGYDSTGEEIDGQFCCPASLALRFLEDQRIAFLNVSYHFLDGKLDVENQDHLKYVEDAYLTNQAVLERSEWTLLCGEAKEIRSLNWPIPNAQDVVHPDHRNSISQYQGIQNQWNEYWSQGALKRFLDARQA